MSGQLRELAPPTGPGWTVERRDGSDWWVWAPRAGRPHWAACWQNGPGTDGDFRRGETLEAVLVIFPAAMAQRFRAAAAEATP
jgi:hypothetical protein